MINPMIWYTGTAQITPMELVTKMLDAALQAGAEVLIDTVEDVLIETRSSSTASDHNRITGVILRQGGAIKASKIIFAMGPWTAPLLEAWLDGVLFPMEGIKSTSCIYEDVEQLKLSDSAYACFCDEDENSCHLELYPRPNGDLYVCGCGGSDHVSGNRLLPGGDCAHAGIIEADPARVAAAHNSFKMMSIIAAEKSAPDIVQVIVLLLSLLISLSTIYKTVVSFILNGRLACDRALQTVYR